MTKLIEEGYRTCSYRLKPTFAQEEVLRNFASVCRFIYNLALEQRRDWYKQFKRLTGKPISFASQCKELTMLRSEFEWIRRVSATVQQQVLRDLDKAYRAFFRFSAGYPSFRNKVTHNTFRFKGDECKVERINRRWSKVFLSKIGWVKFRDTRAMSGSVLSATVNLTSLGWKISFCNRVNVAKTDNDGSVGIDRGVTIPMMLSSGTAYCLPESIGALEIKHRESQRESARRKRGSKRHAKAVKRSAQIKAKQARVRKHWAHETTTEICRNFGTVVIEDLKTKNMTRSAKGTQDKHGKNVRAKSGLNRSILNVGWNQIEGMLAYKTDRLIKVNPAYTSQTCSACGVKDKGSRKSQARFKCLSCGHSENADLNAAKNILYRGSAPSIEASMCGAVDVQTIANERKPAP